MVKGKEADHPLHQAGLEDVTTAEDRAHAGDQRHAQALSWAPTSTTRDRGAVETTRDDSSASGLRCCKPRQPACASTSTASRPSPTCTWSMSQAQRPPRRSTKMKMTVDARRPGSRRAEVGDFAVTGGLKRALRNINPRVDRGRNLGREPPRQPASWTTSRKVLKACRRPVRARRDKLAGRFGDSCGRPLLRGRAGSFLRRRPGAASSGPE